jgi:hypothetical protein
MKFADIGVAQLPIMRPFHVLDTNTRSSKLDTKKKNWSHKKQTSIYTECRKRHFTQEATC